MVRVECIYLRSSDLTLDNDILIKFLLSILVIVLLCKEYTVHLDRDTVQIDESLKMPRS